jgi:hypothetical protein
VGILAIAIIAIVCWAIVRKRNKARQHSVLREELSTFSSGSGTWNHDMTSEVRQIPFESVMGASAMSSAFLDDDLDELL